jgi:hypothetical protein
VVGLLYTLHKARRTCKGDGRRAEKLSSRRMYRGALGLESGRRARPLMGWKAMRGELLVRVAGGVSDVDYRDQGGSNRFLLHTSSFSITCSRRASAGWEACGGPRRPSFCTARQNEFRPKFSAEGNRFGQKGEDCRALRREVKLSAGTQEQEGHLMAKGQPCPVRQVFVLARSAAGARDRGRSCVGGPAAAQKG